MREEPLYISNPCLPNIQEYKHLLHKIWNNGILTNHGPYCQKLEHELKSYLKTESEVILVNNCTSGLEIAIKALGEFKNHYVTPFSFIATLSCLQWMGCKNIIFPDIDEATFNINVNEIEPTDNSLGLFTHVFGNPCKVEKLEDKFTGDSKLIFDAAHAFDVKIKDKSILDFGDISAVSFHATKMFNTVEGGAIFCKDKELAEKIRSMINFGLVNGQPINQGTNAKLSELHSIMGLANLNNFKSVKDIYNNNYKIYKRKLNDLVTFQLIDSNVVWNFSYCPIILPTEQKVLSIQKKLEEKNIYTRRYFFPSLNTVANHSQKCPVSESISTRVLCLPIHQEVTNEDILVICSTIIAELKTR